MVHKRLIIIFGNNADVGYAGVDHVGQNEVDKAISAAERHGSHGALLRQLRYVFIVDIGKD